MDLNKSIILSTDILSEVLVFLGFSPYLRPNDDLRMVLYHGIGDGNDPCFKYLSDEISEVIFEKHMRYLSYNYNILSLEDSIHKLLKEQYDNERPICSISFDDGLRSVFLKAYPILKRLKIPATVFLNTAVIGNRGMTYLHLLNFMFSKFGVSEITALLNRFKELNLPAVPTDGIVSLEWYINNYEENSSNMLLEKITIHLGLEVEKIAAEENIYMHWNEIEEMQQNGFTFCSHTHNHTPLALLKKKISIGNEIQKSYTILQNNEKNLTFVSFPFGMRKYYGDAAIKCAIDTGHKYIVEVGNGTNFIKHLSKNNILSRVSLGLVKGENASLYSAIEMRPLLKTKIKSSFFFTK